MNVEILVEGQSLVKIDLNLSVLMRVFREATGNDGISNAKSTPGTEMQLRELLSRIDQRSVQFLKALAASESGSITWTKMRGIFGIEEESDWVAYSGSFGKGITRAYRNIMGDKTAKLVWWIDSEWEDQDWDSENCSVYVDGPALVALRAAVAS